MPPRNKFITIIVTGVPGVGKTTVLNKTKEILEQENIEFKIANFGNYMLSVAIKKGWVKHRDELRHLPLRRQLELQEFAARALRLDAEHQLTNKGILFVDTHAVIKTPTGYWPGLPENVVKELKPDSIVVIEAPPEIIYEHHRRDASRKRSDIGGINQISELLSIARVAAMSSAVLVAASVYVVENVEGKPEEAAYKLVALAKMLMEMNNKS